MNNWCAVCGGSVGMAALFLEEGERQKQILDKVDKALVYYLKGFREDGATEEGIGYWAYGFGYYTYYTAMRREIDENYRPAPELLRKLKKIAEFPSLVQISKDIFIPFSDASTDTQIPTGLISYLYKEYGVTPPICEEITPFDFEHCYRFAHLSRNLWWTSDDIFQNTVEDSSVYFKDLQWLVQRKNKCFLAVKGGNNMEEHNHNDTGSFILAIDGEVILTDLGAGPYTAGYFSEKRYEYPHTRSYWHNVPVISEKEQIATTNSCKMIDVVTHIDEVGITMDLSDMYPLPHLSYTRTIKHKVKDSRITLLESITAQNEISVEEGFISTYRPVLFKDGLVKWESKRGIVTLSYNALKLHCRIKEQELNDHMGKPFMAFRLVLLTKSNSISFHEEIIITYSIK